MNTKKGRKWLCGAGVLASCCMLAGCHLSHEWQAATCTTPKTCSIGGETEGEALGHTWVEATCAEPKHCSVCGETEGEALAHTWVEATCAEPKHCSVCGATEGSALEHILTEPNYQQAATCEVCGETVGKPLQAAFEKYGLVPNAELDTEYTFEIACENPKYTTKGKYSFSDYAVFESDERHEALEGYEWRAVTITMLLDDENTYRYGYGPYFSTILDYYDSGFGDTYDAKTDTLTVSYNGTEYPEVAYTGEVLQDVWQIPDTKDEATLLAESSYILKQRIFLRVPKGYDGMVYTFIPAEVPTGLKSAGHYEIAKENGGSIFFRLK